MLRSSFPKLGIKHWLALIGNIPASSVGLLNEWGHQQGIAAGVRGNRKMGARIVRKGWYSAEYGCPDCDWTLYISSSARLTKHLLDEWYGWKLNVHRSEK